jgi:hypothetical protein
VLYHCLVRVRGSSIVVVIVLVDWILLGMVRP